MTATRICWMVVCVRKNIVVGWVESERDSDNVRAHPKIYQPLSIKTVGVQPALSVNRAVRHQSHHGSFGLDCLQDVFGENQGSRPLPLCGCFESLARRRSHTERTTA
jgi:hypothetical protein